MGAACAHVRAQLCNTWPGMGPFGAHWARLGPHPSASGRSPRINFPDHLWWQRSDVCSGTTSNPPTIDAVRCARRRMYGAMFEWVGEATHPHDPLEAGVVRNTKLQPHEECVVVDMVVWRAGAELCRQHVGNRSRLCDSAQRRGGTGVGMQAGMRSSRYGLSVVTSRGGAGVTPRASALGFMPDGHRNRHPSPLPRLGLRTIGSEADVRPRLVRLPLPVLARGHGGHRKAGLPDVGPPFRVNRRDAALPHPLRPLAGLP